MRLIGISEKDQSWIVRTIRTFLPETQIIFFGSRVTGKPTPRKYSDVDIALDNGSPIPTLTLDKLDEAFTESDFPLVVDLSDYQRFDSEFRGIVDRSGRFLAPSQKA